MTDDADRTISCDAPAFVELSRAVLRAGGSIRFEVRGASMHPLVRDRDVVQVEPATRTSLRAGDVALCEAAEGGLVVHRVTGRAPGRPARFVIQGDQASRPDGALPAEQVYGVVTALYRQGARIDMGRPTMRLLGALAALRSRFHLPRHGILHGVARRVCRSLPAFSRYVS
jgi:hypothetical protein